MKYFLVGNPGCDIVEPGEGTLIRQSRNFFGQRRWSYLYSHDGNGPCLTWGPWQTFDMVKAGKYPASREISKAVALHLIAELVERQRKITSR